MLATRVQNCGFGRPDIAAHGSIVGKIGGAVVGGAGRRSCFCRPMLPHVSIVDRMPRVPIHLSLDRDLPVALGAQLRGLVEYGITCGEFRPGDRLPSVRELAEEVGVAPMTVAQVYRGLKEAGLIEGRAGSGTFVSRRTEAGRSGQRLPDYHRRIDALIDEGLALGLSGGTIAGLITARIAARQARGKARQVVLVGIFRGRDDGLCRDPRQVARRKRDGRAPHDRQSAARRDRAVPGERRRPRPHGRPQAAGCCRAAAPSARGRDQLHSI